MINTSDTLYYLHRLVHGYDEYLYLDEATGEYNELPDYQTTTFTAEEADLIDPENQYTRTEARFVVRNNRRNV
jgi:hypothetical protein